MASELGPWNVTVNAYAPGMIPTLLNHFADAPPERQRALLNTLAIRRWGTADEIASLLIFLSSEQACYITGSLIDTSGGKLTVQFPQSAYEESGLL
jgi:3-oxoacyl-[acyl-carrier protein] reductase